MKRRTLLLSGLGAAGALIVGWSALPPRSRLGDASALPRVEGEIALNGWIKIAADGTALLVMPRCEMGQGVHTALAMLVAEELELPLRRVRLLEAGQDSLYGNVAAFLATLPLHPRDTEPGRTTMTVRVAHWMVSKVARELGISATGGSSSVADAWEPLRLAAATARAQLVAAAVKAWQVAATELAVHDGMVRHRDGRQAHFGELALPASTASPGAVHLKDPSRWTLIGRAEPRVDVPAKSDGSARFGIDVRPAGLLYATVRHAPALGGGVGRIDADAVLKMPGVLRVVRLPAYAGGTPAVAVVATSSWHALRAADALDVQWLPRPGGALDSRSAMFALEQAARAAADSGAGTVFHRRGDADSGGPAPATRIEAMYSAPYLAHATMEPMNCTARIAGGRVELWAPTQVPSLARALAAQVAGVPEEAVTLHVPYLGGGFGRRLDIDYVGQAVRVAQETAGAPVQLLWSREEDMTHDFYRPAGAALLRGTLDARGRVASLVIASAGDAIMPRSFERTLPAFAGPLDLPDKTTSEGLFDLAYDVPHQRMAHVATHIGIPVGSWRSVGHSHNAFFSEGFIDELAHAARQDPLAFRLAMLDDMPRHAAVLRLAAQKAGWGAPLPAGRARGVALHESFGSIVAQVMEVSLSGDGPRVHRVVCAIDCGVAVNPGIVAQQMESSIVFGLGAALHGRIDIEDGVVKQRSFPDYPLLTLAATPHIETHVLTSTRAPGGVGEPGLPPVAPALANALFALTGRRLRELPLRPVATAGL
ncbi:MAG TPA: molybdopterin cofactor-binding domain-containing protein [Albitalea sp.]|uniref:xanthine dehydrogenase family protein molybdopterin-binding subunit n=1 Tax=Piscinibacter sp. TaxID=1903157 RepID=UPI002ED3EC10